MTLLSIHNLTLFKAKKRVCCDVTLNIETGERWGILGPNGSGKTTFLNAIAGLEPYTGEIFFRGRELRTIPHHERALLCGMLFQSSQDIFPQTVFQRCALGRFPHRLSHSKHENVECVTQALKDTVLLAKAKQNVLSLSGGERQRLGIATLLAQNPDVFILDEPTNHLDLRYQIHLLNHFAFLAKTKQKTLLMSLHDVAMASHYCDHIIMIFEHGHFISGNTKNVLNEDTISRLYHHKVHKLSHRSQEVWVPLFESENDS